MSDSRVDSTRFKLSTKSRGSSRRSRRSSRPASKPRRTRSGNSTTVPDMLAVVGAVVTVFTTLAWVFSRQSVRVLQAVNAIPEDGFDALYHSHRIVGGLPWGILAGVVLLVTGLVLRTIEKGREQ